MSTIIGVEASENYFATCWGRGDVYYFGEQVSTFHEGGVINDDGAWRVDSAQ